MPSLMWNRTCVNKPSKGGFLVKGVPIRGLEQSESDPTVIYTVQITIILISYIIIYYY
jgi:hypothetical protein